MVIGYPFAGIATAVFGVPLFLLGRRLGLIFWWSAIVAGFAIGILVHIVIDLERFDYFLTQVMNGDVRSLLYYGVAGAISGFAFWLIWSQGQRASRQPS
jgi:hypothetical protein